MKQLVKSILVLAATALLSSSAFAQISFTDDFESYVTPPDGNAIGGGWLAFANVFEGFPACDPFLYNYGAPFLTPNSNSAFSNITVGATGQALNVFSNYDDDQHANGNCIETSVFQERVVTAADADSYTFEFDTEVPAPLGTDVNTFGFIKLLDPNNGFSLDLFETVSTITAGSKTITVALDATADGKILQWGFSTVASNYLASGRLYDNVEFAVTPVVVPPGPGGPRTEGVPIPLWAFLGMVGLIGLVGGSKLRSKGKA
ncbi:MAG: hypothetical protein WBN41_09035 [Lysobacterales bacterium]